jgi:endonuclease YncB( thermonuclease family)
VPSRFVLITLLVLVAIGIGYTRLQPAGAPLTGRAEAIDGDTLRLGSIRVRLMGLDAPELDQPCTRSDGAEWSCGREAKATLAARLREGPIDCARYGRDIYGRTLAKCSSDGADLGADIVRAGWAVSNDTYTSEAAEAQSQHLGIWSGTFAQPADWRRSHGADQPGLWEWIRSWFQ